MSSPLASAALGLGVTCYHAFDGTSGGTIVDSAGSANATWDSAPAAYAQAPLFPGSSDCARVAASGGQWAAFNLDLTGSAGWSMNIVLQSDSNVNFPVAGEFGGGATDIMLALGFESYMGGDSTHISFAGYDGSAWLNGGAGVATACDGDPHMWTVTYDPTGGEVNLYKDGTLVNTFTGTVPSLAASTDNIFYAKTFTGFTQWAGSISDGGWWPGTILDQTAVDALWDAAGSSGPPTPPEGQFSTVSWG